MWSLWAFSPVICESRRRRAILLIASLALSCAVSGAWAQSARLVPIRPSTIGPAAAPLPVKEVLEVGNTIWVAAGRCGLYRKGQGDVLDRVPVESEDAPVAPCTENSGRALDVAYVTELAYSGVHTFPGAAGSLIAVTTRGLFATEGKSLEPFAVVTDSGTPIPPVEHIAMDSEGMWLGTPGGVFQLPGGGEHATRHLDGHVTFLDTVDGILYAATNENLYWFQNGTFDEVVEDGEKLRLIDQVLSVPVGLVALNRQFGGYATLYRIQERRVVDRTPYVVVMGPTSDGLLYSVGNTVYLQRKGDNSAVKLALEFFPPKGPVELLGDYGGYRLVGTGNLLTRMSGPHSKLIHLWHKRSDRLLDHATPAQSGVFVWGSAGLFRLDESKTVSATTDAIPLSCNHFAVGGLGIEDVFLSDVKTPEVIGAKLEGFEVIQTTTRGELENKMLAGDFRAPEEEVVRVTWNDYIHRAVRDLDGNVTELPTLRSVLVISSKVMFWVTGILLILVLLCLLYRRGPRGLIRLVFIAEKVVRKLPYCGNLRVTAATWGAHPMFGSRYRKFLKIDGHKLPKHSIGLDAELANVPASETVAAEVEASVVAIAKKEKLIPVTIHVQSVEDLTQEELRGAATERLKGRLRLEEADFFDSLYTHAQYWFLVRLLEGHFIRDQAIRTALQHARASGHRYTIIRDKMPPEPLDAEIDFPPPPEV